MPPPIEGWLGGGQALCCHLVSVGGHSTFCLLVCLALLLCTPDVVTEFYRHGDTKPLLLMAVNLEDASASECTDTDDTDSSGQDLTSDGGSGSCCGNSSGSDCDCDCGFDSDLGTPVQLVHRVEPWM